MEELEKKLKAACIKTSEHVVKDFFTCLLSQEVLLAKLSEPIEFEDKKCVPAFTSIDSLKNWKEVPYISVKGSMLKLMIPENCWVYLNPDSEFGKELSPWEIALLFKGPEAIDELVEYQLEDTDYYSSLTYEHETAGESLTKIKTVLESYPEVEEAFFVWMDSKPVIGLSNVNSEISSLLVNELQQQLSEVSVVPSSSKLFEELFLETNPFYIKQHEYRSGKGVRSFKFWKRGNR